MLLTMELLSVLSKTVLNCCPYYLKICIGDSLLRIEVIKTFDSIILCLTRFPLICIPLWHIINLCVWKVAVNALVPVNHRYATHAAFLDCDRLR